MKVVSINSKRVLGSTIDLLSHHQNLDNVVLFSGAITSILLPQIICSALGAFPMIISISSMVLGTGIGVLMHNLLPCEFPPFKKKANSRSAAIFNKDDLPKSQPAENESSGDKVKKAA